MPPGFCPKGNSLGRRARLTHSEESQASPLACSYFYPKQWLGQDPGELLGTLRSRDGGHPFPQLLGPALRLLECPLGLPLPALLPSCP